MKVFSFARLVLGFTIIIILFYLYWTAVAKFKNANSSLPQETNKQLNKIEKAEIKKIDIVVAVVCCGDRLQETLTMLKSAIMFTKVHITLIVITEDSLLLSFKEKLSEWRTMTKEAFSFKVMPLTFPKDNSQEWMKLFKPCASQRLFLPSVLPDVDSVLYMDTDTLFLTPVEDVWSHFDVMNSTQMAALVPEHEDPNVGWYNRFARHPYYGPLGVNSGVMLMNLTRMRTFKWTEYVVPIYKKYKLKITWGDQDIINIIFHYHPGKLYIYSCRYNFRPDHCMYMSVCKQAEKDGVAVIHGSRGFFHSEKQPVFQAIYRSFEEYQIGGDLYNDFYLPMEAYLDLASESNCGHIRYVFLKNLKNFMSKTYEELKESKS